MGVVKNTVKKKTKTALQKLTEELKRRTKGAVESVNPGVAAALAGLGAVSQTDQMQDIGSAAIDVTGSRREKGDGFLESYVPGFGPSDRIKSMSKADRMAEIKDFGKRRREKNNKSDKPTDKPATKFKLTPKDVTSDQLKKAGLSLGQAGLTKYLNKAKKLGRRPKASDFANVVKKSGGGVAEKKPVKKKVTSNRQTENEKAAQNRGEEGKKQARNSNLRDLGTFPLTEKGIKEAFNQFRLEKAFSNPPVKKKVVKKANGGMATKWESKWR